jgi:hypothetical protein
MMKKISVSLILVIIVAFLVSGIAMAAEEDVVNQAILGGRLIFGEVITIETNQFTIKTRGGGDYTYLVDLNTRVRMRDLETPTVTNIQIGKYVVGAAGHDKVDLIARVVWITPEGFDPARWFGIRARVW